MRPSAIIFDMDGLLLDTERVYFAGYRHALAHHGLPPDDDTFRAMVGTNRELGRSILSRGLAGRVSLDDFDAIWDAEISRIFDGGIPAKPGVRDVINTLRQHDLPHIIATSTGTAKAHHHLARAGLSDLFPDIIGGDQVSRSKPAPDIYLSAAAALGLPPARCAAFEDSANGVRAAHAAGCITVQVPDIVPPTDEIRALCHHVADDLASGIHALGLVPA